MKKILLILMMMLAMPVYATTMCAINDTTAVILDPSIVATNYGYDTNLGTWWAQFSFGRVNGIASIHKQILHTWGSRIKFNRY